MTNEMNDNLFEDMGADVPEDTVRDHGAALVRNGVSLDEVNQHLAGRNAAPLKANSLEMAELARERLIQSDDFRKRLNENDPVAIDQLHMADTKVARANGKLTDRDMNARDYNLNIAGRMLNQPIEEVQKFNDGFSSLAADLKLREEVAQSIANLHLDAVTQTNGMTDDQREAFGHEQTQMFESVLGDDPAAKIKEAEGILTRTSGRKLDLSQIAKSNGADVALALLHQAASLQYGYDKER